MGRLSQMFAYFNEEEHPTKLQLQHHYTAITITPELKQERARRLREKRKLKQGTLFEENNDG